MKRDLRQHYFGLTRYTEIAAHPQIKWNINDDGEKQSQPHPQIFEEHLPSDSHVDPTPKLTTQIWNHSVKVDDSEAYRCWTHEADFLIAIYRHSHSEKNTYEGPETCDEKNGKFLRSLHMHPYPKEGISSYCL